VRRREVIVGLVGAVATARTACAQETPVPVVGYVGGSARLTHLLSAFHRGLREAGYFEGESVTIEYRWVAEDYTVLPAVMDELLRAKVRLIVVAGGTQAVRAAKAASKTTPIVFLAGADPTRFGTVEPQPARRERNRRDPVRRGACRKAPSATSGVGAQRPYRRGIEVASVAFDGSSPLWTWSSPLAEDVWGHAQTREAAEQGSRHAACLSTSIERVCGRRALAARAAMFLQPYSNRSKLHQAMAADAAHSIRRR
jgi:hypothetical protein